MFNTWDTLDSLRVNLSKKRYGSKDVEAMFRDAKKTLADAKRVGKSFSFDEEDKSLVANAVRTGKDGVTSIGIRGELTRAKRIVDRADSGKEMADKMIKRLLGKMYRMGRKKKKLKRGKPTGIVEWSSIEEIQHEIEDWRKVKHFYWEAVDELQDWVINAGDYMHYEPGDNLPWKG